MTSGKLADTGLQPSTATNVSNVFMMRANSQYSIAISKFYVYASSKLAPVLGALSNQYHVDYIIKDAHANDKTRIVQSEFQSLFLVDCSSRWALKGYRRFSIASLTISSLMVDVPSTRILPPGNPRMLSQTRMTSPRSEDVRPRNWLASDWLH